MTTSVSNATEASAPSGFAALNLSEPVLRAIDEVGYTEPTPVQAATYPVAITGRDIIVQARTGTGKTAAFGIPLVDKLVSADPWVQALVLAPTRELAVQSQREIARLAQFKGLQTVAIYGGAPMGRQIDELKSGAQIVSGTPGRVLDHLRRGTLEPARLKVLVLDEMDEMLSMGFAKELNAILEMIPPKGRRQTMCFSATVDGEIRRHAERHMHEPEMISLSSDAVSAAQITHQVYMVSGRDRIGDLVRVLEVEDPDSAIIFCNMRSETERVATGLIQAGFNADWLNGDLPQKDRERIMSSTREGKLRYLVATDVAARGIDISHLTHVINFTFPESAAVYVHRTGRTGRAGRTGCAISLVGPEELGRLYYLRLEYKISPVERSMPTHGELKTRQEIDRIGLLEAAFADRPNPNDLSVARRLLTHPENERILAGLLHTFFGTKDDVDEEAAAARRSKPGPDLDQAERAARERDRFAGRDRGRDDRSRPRDRDRDDRGRSRDRDRDRNRDSRPPRDRDSTAEARDRESGSDAPNRDRDVARSRDRDRGAAGEARSRDRDRGAAGEARDGEGRNRDRSAAGEGDTSRDARSRDRDGDTSREARDGDTSREGRNRGRDATGEARDSDARDGDTSGEARNRGREGDASREGRTRSRDAAGEGDTSREARNRDRGARGGDASREARNRDREAAGEPHDRDARDGDTSREARSRDRGAAGEARDGDTSREARSRDRGAAGEPHDRDARDGDASREARSRDRGARDADSSRAARSRDRGAGESRDRETRDGDASREARQRTRDRDAAGESHERAPRESGAARDDAESGEARRERNQEPGRPRERDGERGSVRELRGRSGEARDRNRDAGREPREGDEARGRSGESLDGDRTGDAEVARDRGERSEQRARSRVSGEANGVSRRSTAAGSGEPRDPDDARESNDSDKGEQTLGRSGARERDSASAGEREGRSRDRGRGRERRDERGARSRDAGTQGELLRDEGSIDEDALLSASEARAPGDAEVSARSAARKQRPARETDGELFSSEREGEQATDAEGARSEGAASSGRRKRKRSRDRKRERSSDSPQLSAADEAGEQNGISDDAPRSAARQRSRGASAEAKPLVAVDGELVPADANGADEGEHEQAEATEPLEGLLYLNLGKRDGLRVPEVARLLRDSCELTRGQIGRIRVRDRYTFVDVPEARLDGIITTLNGQVVHDKPLAPERAKTSKS